MTDYRKRIGKLVLHWFAYPGSRTLLIKWRDSHEWRWNVTWGLSFSAQRTKPERQPAPVAESAPDILTAAMANVDRAEAGA